MSDILHAHPDSPVIPTARLCPACCFVREAGPLRPLGTPRCYLCSNTFRTPMPFTELWGTDLARIRWDNGMRSNEGWKAAGNKVIK